MKPTLLVMAAGLGSRFGGVKQLAKVGPNGEAFLDLSIKDALTSGFGDVVMIVRSDIEQDVAEHITAQHDDVAISYVRQDDLGPARAKPWGTTHAILSAAQAISKPFCVINADDFYGLGSFKLAAQQLYAVSRSEASTVAFEIGKTVPPSGSVSRGVCEVVDEQLIGIVETESCERLADGTVAANGVAVDPTTPVSMNMWCFHPDSLEDFYERWLVFLETNADEPKAECQLPTVVGELMDAGVMTVSVLSSSEQWIGITNPNDFDLAKAALAERG